MAITVSAPQNIGSPNGNSLALYKDASTGVFYIKDINGQIEPLSVSSGFVSGSGITGQIPKWKDASTLDDSVITQDSSGNIGINTTSPLEKLEVVGTMYATPILYTSNQDAYALKIGASNNILFDMGIKIKSNSIGTPYISICSTTEEDAIVVKQSFVGIGIAEPLGTEKLRVEGTVLADVQNSSAYGFRALNSLGVADSGIRFNVDSAELLLSNSSDVQTVRLGSNLDSYINGGKLGIGTITPTSKLEVQGGDVEVGDFNNGVILQSPDATRYRIQVENGGTLSVTAI